MTQSQIANCVDGEVLRVRHHERGKEETTRRERKKRIDQWTYIDQHACCPTAVVFPESLA